MDELKHTHFHYMDFKELNIKEAIYDKYDPKYNDIMNEILEDINSNKMMKEIVEFKIRKNHIIIDSLNNHYVYDGDKFIIYNKPNRKIVIKLLDPKDIMSSLVLKYHKDGTEKQI